MAEKGDQTRERILAVSEPLILRQGFAGTSLDDILRATGLTKGAFFHHFRSKGDLARALVERYAHNDYSLFAAFAAKAEALSDDALQQTFIFLRLFEDFILGQAEPLPGCVFASYTYESQQFDPTIHRFIGESLARWSRLYEEKFAAVLRQHRPRRATTASELASMIVALIEGGFILSRSSGDPHLIARLSRQFREYLEFLFDAEAVAPVSAGSAQNPQARGGPRRPRRAAADTSARSRS